MRLSSILRTNRPLPRQRCVSGNEGLQRVPIVAFLLFLLTTEFCQIDPFGMREMFDAETTAVESIASGPSPPVYPLVLPMETTRNIAPGYDVDSMIIEKLMQVFQSPPTMLDWIDPWFSPRKPMPVFSAVLPRYRNELYLIWFVISFSREIWPPKKSRSETTWPCEEITLTRSSRKLAQISS